MKKRMSIFLSLLISISSSGLGSCPSAVVDKHESSKEVALTQENLELNSGMASGAQDMSNKEVRKKAYDDMERFIANWIRREEANAADVAEYKRLLNVILGCIEDEESRSIVDLFFKRLFKNLIVGFIDITKSDAVLRSVKDYLSPEDIAEVESKLKMESLSDTEQKEEVCQKKTWVPEWNLMSLGSLSTVFNEKEIGFIKIMECFLQRKNKISDEEKFELSYAVCRFIAIDGSSKEFAMIFKKFYKEFLD